jgi:hypothetical protein
VRGLFIDLLSGFLRTCSLAAEAELAQLDAARHQAENVPGIEVQRLVA